MTGPFAAVLLAGGRSRRMGRDKALLTLADGRLLWRRQLDVLCELAPAEVFISGPEKAGFPAEVRRLDDGEPELGPLSGLAAAFEAMRSPWLVVLAVDLPAMTTDFLRGLLAESGERNGIVPRHADNGFYEPLAAVYPRSCLPLARQRLDGNDHSLHGFIRAAGAVIRPHEITPDEEPLFVNWNGPADFAPARNPT